MGSGSDNGAPTVATATALTALAQPMMPVTEVVVRADPWNNNSEENQQWVTVAEKRRATKPQVEPARGSVEPVKLMRPSFKRRLLERTRDRRLQGSGKYGWQTGRTKPSS